MQNPQQISDRMRNAIENPEVEFGIVPSPKLRELLAKDEHPAVQKLPLKHKYTMLNLPDGHCVLVGRELVKRYVFGQVTADEKFVLDNCDVRVIGLHGLHKAAEE